MTDRVDPRTGFVYHVFADGETAWQETQLYGMSLKEFERLNKHRLSAANLEDADGDGRADLRHIGIGQEYVVGKVGPHGQAAGDYEVLEGDAPTTAWTLAGPDRPDLAKRIVTGNFVLYRSLARDADISARNLKALAALPLPAHARLALPPSMQAHAARRENVIASPDDDAPMPPQPEVEPEMESQLAQAEAAQTTHAQDSPSTSHVPKRPDSVSASASTAAAARPWTLSLNAAATSVLGRDASGLGARHGAQIGFEQEPFRWNFDAGLSTGKGALKDKPQQVHLLDLGTQGMYRLRFGDRKQSGEWSLSGGAVAQGQLHFEDGAPAATLLGGSKFELEFGPSLQLGWRKRMGVGDLRFGLNANPVFNFSGFTDEPGNRQLRLKFALRGELEFLSEYALSVQAAYSNRYSLRDDLSVKNGMPVHAFEAGDVVGERLVFGLDLAKTFSRSKGGKSDPQPLFTADLALRYTPRFAGWIDNSSYKFWERGGTNARAFTISTSITFPFEL